MKTKTIFALLSIIMLPLNMTANNQNNAKALLDKTYDTYRASEGIRLSFTSASIDKEGNPYNIQKGEAYVKGDMFKLEMEAMDIWFDGKTQWVYIREGNEVNISQPNAQEVASISPMALLGIYKNGYKLKKPISVTINGKEAFKIEMTPEVATSDFKSISVAIDKKSSVLMQLLLTLNNGDVTQINISEYNSNYKFINSEFAFDKSEYPGVEIIDLQ